MRSLRGADAAQKGGNFRFGFLVADGQFEGSVDAVYFPGQIRFDCHQKFANLQVPCYYSSMDRITCTARDVSEGGFSTSFF